MMKFSFQTFCLVFLVTIVHLVLITVFAPLSDTAGDYFAELDVEEMLEQGRADLAAMMNEEFHAVSDDGASDGDTAGLVSGAGARESDESARAEGALREEAEAVSLMRREEGSEAGTKTQVAEPVAVAPTKPLLLSDRVSKPDPVTIAIAKPVGDEAESAVGQTAKGADVSIAQGLSSKPREETAGARIREIRPIPRR